MEPAAFAPQHLSWLEALARIGAAVAFSLILGIERFLRHKPIDFRPFVIIALASCALVLALMEVGAETSISTLAIDPGRVMSGVMSGIGFLGAGALFREKQVVQGAGSAAAIWASGAIGIVCGLGLLWLAAIVTAVIVLLFLLGRRYADDYAAGGVVSAEEDDQR